jgi:DNA-binding NtrC family response regulator
VAIAEEALVLLERYRWPGNVRELQNVIEQMASMTAGDEIGIEDLPPSIAAPQGSHAYPRKGAATPRVRRGLRRAHLRRQALLGRRAHDVHEP